MPLLRCRSLFMEYSNHVIIPCRNKDMGIQYIHEMNVSISVIMFPLSIRIFLTWVNLYSKPHMFTPTKVPIKLFFDEIKNRPIMAWLS